MVIVAQLSSENASLTLETASGSVRRPRGEKIAKALNLEVFCGWHETNRAPALFVSEKLGGRWRRGGSRLRRLPRKVGGLVVMCDQAAYSLALYLLRDQNAAVSQRKLATSLCLCTKLSQALDSGKGWKNEP